MKTKAKIYRIPTTTTPEDLEMKRTLDSRTILTFGDRVLVAGYFYNPNGRSYYGAIYRFTTSDHTCEGQIELVSIFDITPASRICSTTHGAVRMPDAPDKRMVTLQIPRRLGFCAPLKREKPPCRPARGLFSCFGAACNVQPFPLSTMTAASSRVTKLRGRRPSVILAATAVASSSSAQPEAGFPARSASSLSHSSRTIFRICSSLIAPSSFSVCTGLSSGAGPTGTMLQSGLP